MTSTVTGRCILTVGGTIHWVRVLKWIKRGQWAEQQHLLFNSRLQTQYEQLPSASLQDIHFNGDYPPQFKLFLPEICFLSFVRYFITAVIKVTNTVTISNTWEYLGTDAELHLSRHWDNRHILLNKNERISIPKHNGNYHYNQVF